MNERFAGLEARLNKLEGPSSRTSAMNMIFDESQEAQGDQNRRRAVAGFRDDTSEHEVETSLISTVVEAGMSKERIQIKCPAKPITHAFLQFTDSIAKVKKKKKKSWVSELHGHHLPNTARS